MTTTTHRPTPEVTMGAITRTYATFSIRWTRGSTWSGYRSADEAQTTIDRSDDPDATVQTKTWTVDIDADKLGIYQPGNAGVPDKVVAR